MKNIDLKLNRIFAVRTGIDFSENENLKDKPLFGNKCNVPVRELVMVCVDIEKEFKVKIPESKIINGEFKTYNRIYEMLNCLIDDLDKVDF